MSPPKKFSVRFWQIGKRIWAAVKIACIRCNSTRATTTTKRKWKKKIGNIKLPRTNQQRLVHMTHQKPTSQPANVALHMYLCIYIYTVLKTLNSIPKHRGFCNFVIVLQFGYQKRVGNQNIFRQYYHIELPKRMG